jgi:NAD-dependent deacetylase
VTRYQNIVVLTGAGLSAESGLGTFRGPGGLWENHRIEDVATPEAFARDPVRVHDFYNLRRSWHIRHAQTQPISPLPGSSASTAMC